MNHKYRPRRDGRLHRSSLEIRVCGDAPKRVELSSVQARGLFWVEDLPLATEPGYVLHSLNEPTLSECFGSGLVALVGSCGSERLEKLLLPPIDAHGMEGRQHSLVLVVLTSSHCSVYRSIWPTEDSSRTRRRFGSELLSRAACLESVAAGNGMDLVPKHRSASFGRRHTASAGTKQLITMPPR